MKPWILFAFSAAIFWGAYVPAIAQGQSAFNGTQKPYRAFLFVGLAYCILAVLVPAIYLFFNNDGAGFTGKGATISTFAGTLGAAGALCVIFALRNGGTSTTVAPIVFALAPIVNVVISMIIDAINGKFDSPPWQFYVGLLFAAAGVYLILTFNPAAHKPTAPAITTTTTTTAPITTQANPPH